MHVIRCSEVWGGIKNADLDVCTGGVTASLYSGAADGGKGGDIYYFSVCGSDMLTRVALADVQGHGPAVSRLSQLLYDVLAERMNSPEGDGVLSDLNREVCGHGFEAITTAAVIAYYKKDGRLYVAYAGHPPVLIRRRIDRTWRAVLLQPAERPANLPLGVTAETPYDQTSVPLAPGDRVFLYTDGLIEARDRAEILFGDHRLAAALGEAAECDLMAVKNAVLGAVRQHAGGPLIHDDVTLMALEIR